MRINHAHNDLVEWLVDTGLAGALLLVGLVGWWVKAGARLMRDAGATVVARGAHVAAGVMLLHGLLDYPLRTPALAMLFAAMLALSACHRRAAPSARAARHHRRG